MHSVDLNCDLGEGFGRYTLGLDSQVIPLVSSCNIACGMHAGDPVVMQRTVALAAEAGIAVGAHPGYPDLQGFGRRDIGLSPDEAYAYTVYQVGALAGFCAAAGIRLQHVKPHGQLYNRAAVDADLACAIARAVSDVDPCLVLVGLANGELIAAGRKAGLAVAQEFFTDRAYTEEGVLISRALPGALITDEEFAVRRAVRAVKEGTVEAASGKDIKIRVNTLCVHGDNAHALGFVRRIRAAFEANGITVGPVGGGGRL